jgi:hypothetical protein
MSADPYLTKIDILRDQLKIAESQIISLLEQRDELRSQNERLKSDKSRLDWMDSARVTIIINDDSKEGRYIFGEFSEAGTLRETLDSEMKDL